MKQFKPMLFSDLRGYKPNQLVRDVIAGVIVAIIALPLSIALAIASGVGPEAGLYTAIVAGFIAAFFGGSSVQISGPTAAFATIVAGIVARSGVDGLALATILAGVLLIVMAVLKLGNLIRFIPHTITTGFTAGIAVTLVVGQLKDFFGVVYQEKPIETIEKLELFIEYIGTVNVSAIIVGLVCLAILIIWPKIKFLEKVPASLIAVGVGIVMVKGFGMQAKTIGDLFGEIKGSWPAFRLPGFSVSKIAEVFPDAITIALLAGIESLLSCVVADGMINRKHRSNAELLGQGLGNIGSAMFGGIPATGAIARTAANIKNGGRSPISGIVHSIVLLIILVVLMPYAAWIPMSAIAAILIHVAYNMCQWRQFVYLVKTSPKSDILILVTTFVLTVVFDLVVAIEVGLVAACVLFMRRLSNESKVESWQYVEQEDADGNKKLCQVPKHICVYELKGPMFFAVAGEIAKIEPKAYTKCIIIRMGAVPSVDTDALRMLEQFVKKCKEENITVVFSHVNPQPLKAMKKSGLYALVEEENFCRDIATALERGTSLQ
ncbi:MAG: STAS domain-containing protein [Ruminococcaceae bacterium]|nr:STAS domain-containing protein [Oscillospiraceae bacterium]